MLAGYLAGLGLELTGPAAPPQDAQLTAWLESHPIGTGLSGYWEANVVTLASGGRVAVRPVTIADGRIVADRRRGQGRLVQPGPFPGGLRGAVPWHQRVPRVLRADQQAVLATFGKPGRVYQVGQYTILWWPKNLLADIAG